MQECGLADQARVSVEVFRRDKAKFWLFEAIEELQDILKPKAVGMDISVAAIHEGIKTEECTCWRE